MVYGFDLSASAGYTVSNATNLSQLRGKFDFATTGEQIVGGTSLTVFWNSSHTVYGEAVDCRWRRCVWRLWDNQYGCLHVQGME